MTEMEHPIMEPKIQEETFEVLQDQNILIVELRGHKWAALYMGNKPIVRDLSRENTSVFSVSPGTYTIRTDGKIEKIESKAIPSTPPLSETKKEDARAILQLKSDAPDQHIVDGIGEIPADGKSFCTITVEKVGMNGKALTGRGHQDELFLRTTGGTLMDNKGKERVRSLKLKSGKASFRIVSENNPKVVTVTVFGKGPLLFKGEIQIEFI